MIHKSFTVLPILLMILSGPVFSQGTWEIIDAPTTQSLKSVCFVDSLYGWACGDSGTIIHTSDGGNTWMAQETNLDNEIVCVHFLDRDHGWASAFNFSAIPYGTILLKTTNGGETWTASPYQDPEKFITCILFRDTLNGWMGGKPHALVRTTDGGNTWVQAQVDTSTLAFFPVLGIYFYNEKYGYACGGMFDIAGVIWRTKDGGDSWSAIDPVYAPADEVHALYLFDSIHVMGAGGDPDFGYGVGMIKTWDGGETWTYQELGLPGYALDLAFRNDREAWAPVGIQRKFVYSPDAGSTWQAIDTPDSTIIVRVTFPDSLHGYAVGRYGAVLKFRPPVSPGILPAAGSSDGFLLCQNYPNPVNTKATFKMQNAKPGHFTLILFNMYGKEVAVLLDGDLPPGVHEVGYDTSGLPSGIYLYRLLFRDLVSGVILIRSKRMVIAGG